MPRTATISSTTTAGSGELAYDEDGSGGRAPHVFFTLKGAPHLDAGDIIILA